MTTTDDDIGGSGYSLEQLSDYLDRGRTPAIAEIDENPACQAMLDSLGTLKPLDQIKLVKYDIKNAAAKRQEYIDQWRALMLAR